VNEKERMPVISTVLPKLKDF